MTEEEKKITKRLKDDIALVTFNDNLNYGIGNLYVNINDLKIILNLISKLQTDIDIKDKVIDLAIKMIDNYENQLNISNFKNKKEIKEFLFKKVEEENNETN